MPLGIKEKTEEKGMTLAEYVADLKTDKQEYNAADGATDDYLDAETPEVIDLENPTESGDEHINIVETLGTNEIAEVILSVFNVSYNVFGRAFAGKHIDTTEFEAKPEELATIRKPLRAYLKTKNVAMSPGAALLIAVLAVYGTKTFMLVNAKNQAIKELKQKNATESKV